MTYDDYTQESWGGHCKECERTGCWLDRHGLCGECAEEEDDDVG